ncbi:hypothetical protein PQX77_010695 [Marasmius sp. AFHP31]|nr:hypothetical protein PQX77_010695 [Marasmius sp. AFHP31]
MIGDVNATTSQIWSNWEPSIAKWILFFLRMVLTSVHVPQEEAENTILLHIIDAIPDILNAEDKAASVTAVTKHRDAPYLQPLVAQIWLFLVDIQDPRIGPWSSLLLYLSEHTHHPHLSPSSAFEHDRRISDIPRPYPIDAKLGKRLLVELQLKVRRLTEGKDFRANDFRTFFLILIVGDQCFQGTNPICVGEENYNETLRLMGRVLAIILRKWTWLHKLPIESTQLKDAYSIATSLLFAFRDFLRVDTPSRIQQLIESGIVTSLYYAADCYYTLGRAEATTGTDGFIEATTNLLDRIATFLSHYCVLRALIRDIHGFWRTALDNFSPGIKQSKDLRYAWSNLLGKADELYLIRWNMKQRGLCEHDGCPISRAPQSPRNLSIRYFRCSGCSTTVYCSRACRKADWAIRHKKECPQRAEAVRYGRPYMDRNDMKSIGLLLDRYIRTHAREFIAMVENHRRSNTSARELQARNPIFTLNFDRPDLPPVQDAEFHIGVPRELARAEPEFFGAVQRKWEGTRVNELVLWAGFPMQAGRAAFPFTSAIKFPLEGDDTGSFGQRWLRGLRKN